MSRPTKIFINRRVVKFYEWVYPEPNLCGILSHAGNAGIVSHAARTALYHYLYHGTTPLFSRTSTFDTPVCLWVFAIRFSVNRTFSSCGLEYSSLHSARATSRCRSQRIQPITFIFICSWRIARGGEGCMSREWNRDVDTVGIAVKARANNWYLYLDNYTSGLLIELNDRLTRYNTYLPGKITISHNIQYKQYDIFILIAKLYI